MEGANAVLLPGVHWHVWRAGDGNMGEGEGGVIIESPREQWADRIRSAWLTTVTAVLDTGRLIIEAKAQLPSGEFMAMVEQDLPFGVSTADKLVAIYRNPALVNSEHIPKLPPSWGTLYELSRADCIDLDRWIDDDTIHPEMKLNEAKALLRIEKRKLTYNAEIEDGCTVEDLQVLVDSGKKFGVILADPPWTFKVYSGKGKDRSADRHYNTMSLEDIMDLPVAQLAAPDCALFLWGVCPEVPGALAVMKAWGFEFKTKAFTWIKTNQNDSGLHWGMGYWTRANSEDVWLATRGAPKRKAMDVHQVIMSPVGEHSRKPEETQVRIEKLLDGPYLELFGRRPMAGWTVWGNQITRGLFHGEIKEFTAQSPTAA